MKEYGYMEGEYLRSQFFEEKVQKYTDADGVEHCDTITIEEQIEGLSGEWKPVDVIDHDRLENAPEGFVVIPVPHDFGDHIGYKYETKLDLQKIRKEIQKLKNNLSDSDFKIMKCYEASLIGETMPYDFDTLHKERQKMRERINDLENLLLNNSI